MPQPIQFTPIQKPDPIDFKPVQQPESQAQIDFKPVASPVQEENFFERWKNSFGRAKDAAGQTVEAIGKGDWKGARRPAAEAINQTLTATLPIGAAYLAAPVVGAVAGAGSLGAALTAGGAALGRAAIQGGVGLASGALAEQGARAVTKGLGGDEDAQALAGAVSNFVAIPKTAYATKKLMDLARVAPPPAPVVPGRSTEALQKAMIEKRDRLEQNIGGKSWAERVKDKWRYQYKPAIVEANAPVMDYTREELKKAGKSPEEVNKFIQDLENYARKGNRAAVNVDRHMNEVGLPEAITKIGLKDWGSVLGVDRAAQYVRAVRENALIDAKEINTLPDTGGDPAKIAKRYQENAAIIAESHDIAPDLKSFYEFNSRMVMEQLRTGLISPGSIGGMLKHKWDYAKQQPILSPDEIKVQKMEFGQPAQAVGIKKNPVKFLEDEWEREAKDPIIASIESAQEIIKQGNYNMVLQKLAEKAVPGDAGASKIVGVPSQPDLPGLKLFSKEPPPQVPSLPVLFDGKQYHLTGPVDIIGAAKLFGAQALDEKQGLMKETLEGINYLNRLGKMTLTGPLALPWMFMGRALNFYNIAMKAQNPFEALGFAVKYLPKAYKIASGRGHGGDPIATAGERQAALGTSAEIYRGAGSKDVELQAQLAKSPMDTFKWAVVDPIKELAKPKDQRNARVTGRFGRFAENALRATENRLTFDETALRLGLMRSEMKRNLAKGMSPREAEEAAGWTVANAMTDFSRKGTMHKELELVNRYFNATLQGIRSETRFARENPKQFASRMALLSLPMMYFANRAFLDPQMKEIMEGVPAEERSKYLYVATGAPFKRDDRGRVVEGLRKVPVGEAMRPFNALIQGLAYAAYEKGKTAEIVGDMAMGVLNNVSPVPWSTWSVGKGAVPFPDLPKMASGLPVVGPAAEVMVDRNFFTGAPIFGSNTVKKVPEFVRRGLGAEGGTAAWHVAKGIVPPLRYAEEGAPDLNPWSRFTETSQGFRRKMMKEQKRKEGLEKRYGFWGQ